MDVWIPNLYFAIEPNGNIRPCCDYKLDKAFRIYQSDFPENIGVAKFIAKYILIYANVVAVCMGATLKFL